MAVHFTRLLALLFSSVVLAGFSAKAADSIQIITATNRIGSGQPLALWIQTVNSNGAINTNFQGTLNLQQLRRSKPGVVISEIEATNHIVELFNTSNEAADISGWDYQIFVGFETRAHIRFPEGTIIPGGGAVLYSDPPLTNAAVRVFSPAVSNPNWNVASHTLRNGEGNIVDQVFAYASGSSLETVWKGNALGNRFGPWARVGAQNNFNSSDWSSVSTASQGVRNPGLSFPWTGVDVPENSWRIQFTNGVWTGSIPIDGVSSSIVFEVYDDLMLRGSSARVEVDAGLNLSFSFEPSVAEASEASAGLIGKGFVRLPIPALTNISVSLRSTDPSEITVPEAVLIPAGQSVASFEVTNFDDSLADGDAAVTISASAAGYGMAESKLLNRDNEIGQLFVVLPVSAPENHGYILEPGRVFISSPAAHDVEVRLRSDRLLHVPQTVTIPRGKSSALFKVAVDDDRLYTFGLDARVWARTANWPEAQGRMRISRDDDDGGWTLQAPNEIWQGEPGEAILRFNTPRHFDTPITLSSSTGNLLAQNVVLPAGATEVRIPMIFSIPGSGLVLVHGDIGNLAEKTVVARSNIPAIQNLEIGPFPLTAFSGESINVSAALSGPGGPQYTNATGVLRLIGVGSDFTPQSISFNKGTWSAPITLTGEGSGLQFEITAAGFTNRSARFDLVRGGVRNMSVLDFEPANQSDLFLVSEGPLTNTNPRLLALRAPDHQQIVQSIGLPAPATAISASDDGTSAWLIMTNGRFRKVNLTDWTLGPSFPVSTNEFEIARDILVLPGGTDRFVAIVGSASVDPTLSRMELYSNGSLVHSIPVPQVGFLSSTYLVRGRDGDEFFYQGDWNLLHYRIQNNQLLPPSTLAVGGGGNTTYAAGKLYSGVSGVVDPGADQVENRFGLVDYNPSHALVFPERSRLFTFYPTVLTTYDLLTGEKIGSVPTLSFKPSRSFAWSGGFAFRIGNESVLFMSSPFLQSALPDLALKFIGPTAHTNLTVASGNLNRFDWHFEIENVGAGPAPSVIFHAPDIVSLDIGTIQSGENRAVTIPSLQRDPGLFTAEVFVTSPQVDANPTNNRVVAMSVIKSPVQHSGKEIQFAATSLVGSPDRERLYVGFSALPGSLSRGVAVVNPELGTIDRVITNNVAPSRLVITSDGQYLYGLTGSNEVTRWHIQSEVRDQVINTGPEKVLDLITPPTGTRRVVIATDKAINIYEDGSILGMGITRDSSFRCLGFSGVDLWLSEYQRLYRYRVDDGGLTELAGPIAINFPANYYRFFADSQRLYFPGYAYHIASGSLVYGIGVQGFFPRPDLGGALAVNGAGAYLIGSAMEILAEDVLPFEVGSDSALFGHHGIAYISKHRSVVLYQPSGFPLAISPADLQVTVSQPSLPYSFHPLEWQFTVRNNSSNAAQNVRLKVESPNILQDMIWEPTNGMSKFYTSVFTLESLPAGESRVFTLQATTFGGNAITTARVYSNSPDPVPTNNSWSGYQYFGWPLGDLEMISVVGPTNINRGDEATYTFTIRNNSSFPVDNAVVELHQDERTELPDGIPLGVPLAPGETKSVPVRMRFGHAGISYVAGMMRGFVHDTNTFNDKGRLLLYVSDPSVPFEKLSLPASRFFLWNEPRGELIATFADAQWSVMGLDLSSLRPQWNVMLPEQPINIVQTADGNFLWTLFPTGRVNRVNLTTKAIDLDFKIPAGYLWAIASPPGRPHLLLVSVDPNQTGANQVQLFENGIPKPATVPGAAAIVFAGTNRIFITASQFLREIAITPNGLVEIENLDSFAPWGNFTVSTVGDVIQYSNGHAYNVATRQVDRALFQEWSNGVVADPVTKQRYRLGSGGNYLENFGLTNSISDWRIKLSEPSAITPLGTNGVLVSASNLRIVKFNPIERAADLVTAGSGPVSVAGPEIPFTINFSVTNASDWLAAESVLTVSMPANTAVLVDQAWIPTNRFETSLGSFAGSTNLAIQFKSSAAGLQTFIATASSATADPNLTNNSTPLTVSVAPAPAILMDDTSVTEGNSGIQFWLSSPFPSELRVNFSVTPLTAGDNDISQASGVIVFSANSRSSSVAFLANDSIAELTETVRLDLWTTNGFLVRTQAVVTILNDDLPRLSMSSPSSVYEGGESNITTINVNLTLPAAPFPSEVDFETVSNTAIAGRDFISKSGKVRFAPNETTKAIPLEIIGNNISEPNKAFNLVLRNPNSLTLQSSSINITIRNDDPASYSFTIVPLTSTTVGLRFYAQPNVSYRYLTRTNLSAGDWVTNNFGPSINGTNGQFTVVRPNQTNTATFFRLRAVQN